MNYKKLKNLYRLVFYGRNDLNRNQDGTATNSSLIQTNQTRLLTPYITNYISNSYNSKILRFSLNNCFNNVSLAENSYLYLNTYTLPIINNGDRQYFTNLKLLGAGSDKDYNNLSFDNPIIATNFHTGTIAYNPELTPSISSNLTIMSEELLDLDEGIYDVYYTNRTLTTTIVEKGLTTIKTEYQLLECVNPPDADYFIMDDVDLNVNTSGNVLNSTKIYGYNDFYYQLTTNDLKVNILPQSSLKCDVLLVGAGGNGGSNYTINGSNYYGGGGGAGELVYIKDLDVNETDLISIIKNTNETTMTHFKDGSIMTYTAKSGGNGGSFDGTNSVLPTSGGSGGGGMYLNYPSTNYITTTIAPIDVVNNNNFIYYSFTAPNNTTTSYTFTTSRSFTADILIVGGGGGGGRRHGGGGGAGAVIHLQNQTLNTGEYTIEVGKGGNSQPATTVFTRASGNNGDDSIITFNLTTIYRAKGGGGGGSSSLDTLPIAGGSSGGGGETGTSPAVLTTNIPTGSYGNVGGNGGISSLVFMGGGGGGAGGAGNNSSGTTAGSGGNGIQISITGNNTIYGAGGGGGAGHTSTTIGTAGAGGSSGVGGAGSYGNTTAGNGTANTGSGGGGSGFSGNNNGASGAGGSGIVIIRVPKTINTYFNGATAGTSFNSYGIVGDVNNGSTSSSLKAGNGGSATTSNISITGSNLIYGLGGTGASVGSTPASKVGLYGYGGDGNGGVGGDGTIIVRFKDLGSVNTTNITTQYIEQPYSITYTNDFINFDKTKLNSVKLPKNFLNKNYVDFEINTLLSGGSNLTFNKEQLDRLIIDASIIELDDEISN